MYFIGIDLAAKDKNPTGIYIGDEEIIKKIVYKDEEIVMLIENFSPAIISIDSPLTFKIPYREEEMELRKLGFKPLPLSLKSMYELYKRAVRIKEKVEKIKGIKIIETFPRAIEKILGFDYDYFKKYFRNKHIYDAWLCYINSKCYYFNRYIKLKNIYLPNIIR